MLRLFSHLWTKSLTPELTEAYSHALKRYSDDEIREAGYKCLEECERFPKPSEIIGRIKGHVFKDQKPLFNTCRCSVCGESEKLCIKEHDMEGWECRECYSGLSVDEYKDKLRDLVKLAEGS